MGIENSYTFPYPAIIKIRFKLLELNRDPIQNQNQMYFF